MKYKKSVSVLTAAIVAFGISDRLAMADAPPTVESIIALLTSRDKELRSLAAVYRESGRADRDGITGGYLRRAVAFRAPCWFRRDNGHGHSRLDWHQDPLRKTLLIRPGQATLLENLNRLVVERSFPQKELPPFDIQSELLFLVLCWWSYPSLPPPKILGLPWSMSTLLAGGDYRLRPGITTLGTRRCIVLEKPMIDEIWLDASPPHCVLRRQVFEPKAGTLAWRCDFDGHAHHGGNIWLPREFTNQHFDLYATSKEGQKRLVIDGKFEITDLRINDEVLDDDFRLELPAGTVRSEVRDGIEQFVPVTSGQQEHAKAMAEWAVAVSGAQGRKVAPSIRDHIRVMAWSVIGLFVGLGLGLLVVLIRPLNSLLQVIGRRSAGENSVL